MSMKKLFALTFVFVLFCSSQWMVPAQDQPAQQPTTEELEKEKAEREKNAYRLLEQVIDEGQSLKLTENRVRVQINGADILWDQNQGRARSLFMMAAEGIAELGRTQDTPANRRDMVTDGTGNIIFSGPEPRNLTYILVARE